MVKKAPTKKAQEEYLREVEQIRKNTIYRNSFKKNMTNIKNGIDYHINSKGELVKNSSSKKKTTKKKNTLGSTDSLTKTTTSGFHYSGTSYGHVAFLWNGHYINLRLNPQQYQMSSPQRTSTFKTQSTPVIEDFGQDLETITFSGNTGGAKIDADGNNGEGRFRALYNFIIAYQQSSNNGNGPTHELTFFNNMDTGKPSYTVHIPQQGFQYSRDSQNAMLYNYAISLIVIKRASQPDNSEISKSSNGNQANNTDNTGGTNSASSLGKIVGTK